MRIRTGFVSNSSSSSFVCDVCSEVYSGWDASVTDFDHYQCENYHIFCQDQLLSSNKPVKSEDDLDDNEDELYDDDFNSYEVPSERCPICQMKIICDGDVTAYMNKKYGKENIRKEIAEKFKNYAEFNEYLRKKNG